MRCHEFLACPGFFLRSHVKENSKLPTWKVCGCQKGALASDFAAFGQRSWMKPRWGCAKFCEEACPSTCWKASSQTDSQQFLTVVCSGTLSSAPAFRSTTCPSCSVSACIVGASIPYGPAYLIHTAPCTGSLVRHRPAVWKLDEHRHTGHAAPFVRLLAQTSISSGRSVHRRGWLICHGHNGAPKYISATLQPLLGYVPLHATSTAESEFS